MNITSNQEVKLEQMNGLIRNKLNLSFASRKARNAVACKAEQLGDLVVTCALTSQLRNPRLADVAFQMFDHGKFLIDFKS